MVVCVCLRKIKVLSSNPNNTLRLFVHVKFLLYFVWFLHPPPFQVTANKHLKPGKITFLFKNLYKEEGTVSLKICPKFHKLFKKSQENARILSCAYTVARYFLLPCFQKTNDFNIVLFFSWCRQKWWTMAYLIRAFWRLKCVRSHRPQWN